MSGSRVGDGDADEALLAELFDSLLQDVLDGRTPDLDELLPERPDLRVRVRETYELACSVAGRREPGRPVLGGYEIVRELGRGGMGTVYLARHEALDRQVAIKVLPQSLALSARAKRRFLEEARALARLRHDHIVHIHRIVDHGEMLAFEMEYVEGPSLQSLLVDLRQHGPRPLPQHLQQLLGPGAGALGVRSTVEYFVKLGIAIARALAEVHRRGLVHRDVKPSNILLRKNGTPVLADFGLARDGEIGAAHTVTFAGTPIYAAPERLREGDLALDGRADVYSLGVTLYEAITLSPPYQGRSTEELLRKIESGHLVPLRHRAPHVSRDLQTVLQKAMDADARHRYATADEFADDLERLLALQPIHARPKGPLRKLVLAMNRHRKVLVAAAAGAVLVTLGLWPIVAHAQAAATAGERAARHIRTAQLQLLAPECLDLTGWAGRGQSSTTGIDLRDQVAALRRAVSAYDEALAVTPADEALQREHAVAAAALWLRTELPPPGEPTITPRAAGGLALLLERLPPVARRAAQMLVDGSIDLTTLNPLLDGAGDHDRFAVGLLAALLGDLAVCEAAWLPLEASDFDHPLLDAALGRLFATEGEPERAYPRLFHARRAFPSSVVLALELADAALASGDVKLAEQWLADVRAPSTDEHPGHDAETLRRQRLAADLQAAKGQLNEAEAAYRDILAAWPHDHVARHRLAAMATDRGDLARARQHLLRILDDRPDDRDVHVDLARIAAHCGDRAGYLAQARFALTRLRGHERLRGTDAKLQEILRLGRLNGLLAEVNGGEAPAHNWRHVRPPAALWRTPAQLAGAENALRLLSDYDRTSRLVRAAESHPVRSLMLTMQRFARDHGIVLLPVSMPTVVTLAAIWPLTTLAGADVLAELAMPLQRNLGTRVQRVRVVPIGRSAGGPPGIDFGRTLATVGFLDGTEDLLVAAVPRRETDGRGYVEVRSSVADFLLDRVMAPRGGLMFGYSLADVGDLDGDGLRDFAVGAPQTRADPELAAAVFVYSGRDRRLLQELRGSDPIAFGTAIAALGDVDGDGTADFAVGAAPFRRSTMALGSVTVYSGKTRQVLRVHYGDRAGAWFGGSLSSIGDVDGDGCRELVVGGNLGGSTPLVRVYSGRSGDALLTIEERGCHDLGRTVLGVGDIDGDGKDDIALTAPDLDDRDGRPGRVLLCSGRTGARIAELSGDNDADHFGAAICLLPDWRGDHQPAIAVSATAGGVSGTGYVRVFGAASRVPLQTFFMTPDKTSFGSAVASLGSHQSLGRPRLCVVGKDRAAHHWLWTMYFNLDEPGANQGR